MSSSAINAQLFQAKIGSIQNQADSSSVYSAGVWSFKNSTALTSVTITDSGNVGIGTASFSSPASISPKLFVNQIIKFGSYSYIGEDLLDADSLGLVCDSTENICFGQINTGTNTLTERMRIDASGNLGLGVTSLITGNVNGVWLGLTSGTRRFGANTTAAFNQIEFWTSGFAGAITTTGTNTAYGTGPSDYRLKEQVQPLSGGLDKIKALHPVSFVWKESQKQDTGFIAHEIQSVVPEAVVGEKDAVDAEGNPVYQSIFPAPAQMIATLVAALQELSAKVDAQAAEIEALKAK